MIRHRGLILKSALIGVAIELPFAVWLARTIERIHSMAMIVPTVFHLPSLILALLILQPFRSRLSESAANVISLTAACVTQAALLGGVVFVLSLWREKRQRRQ